MNKLRPDYPIDDNSAGGIDQTCIACPCGGTYSHVERVFTAVGSDAQEAIVYNGTYGAEQTSERRSAVAVEFESECGHVFQLWVQQHKGNSFLFVVSDAGPQAGTSSEPLTLLKRSSSSGATRGDCDRMMDKKKDDDAAVDRPSTSTAGATTSART